MLNWIVWNRTVFEIENVYLCKIELFEKDMLWHLTVYKQNLHLYGIVWSLIWR